MRYNAYIDLENDYPGICDTIDRENNAQYPNATFIEAAVSKSYDEDGNRQLVVLFDIGVPNKVLYVLAAGILEDVIPGRGSYIDEYYEITGQEGEREILSAEENNQ